MRFSGESFEKIITNIYDIVLEPNKIKDVLSSLDPILNSQFCHAFALNTQTGKDIFNVVTDANMINVINGYSDYYIDIDPRRIRIADFAVGEVKKCSDYFDDKFVGNNEFYQDCLIKNGLRYILGAKLVHDNSTMAYIAFNHVLGTKDFSEEETKLAHVICRHTSKAVSLMIKNNNLSSGLRVGESFISRMGSGVIVLSKNNTIAYLNERAKDFLSKALCKYFKGGTLSTTTNIGNPIALAVHETRLSRRPSSLVINSTNGLPLVINIICLNEGNKHNLITDCTSHDTGHEILITVVDLNNHRHATPEQLAQLFKLSKAEARLANALARGLSLEEYCEQAFVSINTARTQLRGILAKTGARRQQDLVRLLSIIPPVVSV